MEMNCFIRGVPFLSGTTNVIMQMIGTNSGGTAFIDIDTFFAWQRS